MGNDASTIVLATPLVPQPRFPRVINTRFMLDRVLTLRLPDNGFWSHDETQALEIMDADTNTVMFKIPPKQPTDSNTTATFKQLLLDCNSVPIVSMERYTVGIDYATYIPTMPRPASRATSLENSALCYIETNNRPLENRLLLTLNDPATGGKLNIRADSSWRTHEAVLWLDRGMRRARDCIARVYIAPDVKQAKKQHRKSNTNGNTESGLYMLDIAPGVDVALIVLVCASLDEEMKKRTTGKEVAANIGTDETTMVLAQRHHGNGESRDRVRAKAGTALFVSTDL